MSDTRCCSVCGKTSDEVRLYRDYAEGGILSPSDIWCNKHVRKNKNYVVPCVVGTAGEIRRLFCEPPGTQPDFDRWWSLPEADPKGWTRPMRREVSP